MSNTLSTKTSKDSKFKRKFGESSIMEKNLELSLSLGLGDNYTIHESSSKSTFKSSKGNGSYFDPKPIENSLGKAVIKSKTKEFSCKFCEKKFLNPQALGGHQNTHKRERILAKMDKEFSMGTFGLGIHPYFYLHGSPLYHKGHMHPMAPVSPMPLNNFELGYGNKGFYNTSFSNHSVGMMSNSLGINPKTPQILNHSCEYDQVPSGEGNIVNRSYTTQGDL